MLRFISDTNSKKALYKCDCGKEVEAFKSNVSRGHTMSCGCFRRRVTSERSKIHGHRSKGERSRVYVAWVNMKSRCNNSNRKDSNNYIGRGIKYCRKWESFSLFLMDMGEPLEKMTLDRIDNSKGYNKKNCRWASMQVQNLNKRNCVRYELGGKSMTLAEWSRETGIGRVTLLKRIQRGIPLKIALTTRGFLKCTK